ncbi:hypothetical protein EW026_g7452 [Hermanssonia centrifuga]|uniref:HMG box domain-containing protein n=1 Tax=Hermanssonia centrifuga TaxID=98765 RepID=A0A4S4K8V2_9APHY|nr:hypothetical protein EW026_g7452 [Hermanssonia centrifuga]
MPTSSSSLPLPPSRKPSRSVPAGRNSRRHTDPPQPPRPRNSFIIFRCEFQREYSEKVKASNRSPTPEKMLSKRAGVIWKNMSLEDQKKYRDAAKEEAIEHLVKYPDYKFRPRQRSRPKRRSTGAVNRRESIKSLMREHSSGSQIESGSECERPTSVLSSSPEPTTDDYPHTLSHRRSMSLPHLGPYRFTRTHFIEPVSCASSPGTGPHWSSSRSSSASTREPSPHLPAITLRSHDFEIDPGLDAVPFVSVAARSSTSSLGEMVALPECVSSEGMHSIGFSSAQTSPMAPVHESNLSGYFPAPPATSVPLQHRRHRSNTAPSSYLSPLAVVSSSLGNWNGEMTATAAATSRPGFMSITDTLADLTPTATSLPVTSHSTGDYSYFGGPFVSEPSASSFLTLDTEIDFDRTPRRADFAFGIQDLPMSQPGIDSTSYRPGVNGAGGFASSFGPSYELDSYKMGLDAHSITPAMCDLSFQGDHFDDLFYMGHD